MAFHGWQIDTGRHFHRRFLPNPSWHGWSQPSPRDPSNSFVVRMSESEIFSQPPSCPARARARSLRFYARPRDGGERKGCLSQRQESFMGDYGTNCALEGLAKRFYPAFKREQQMPWHVRSTDAPRRPRCDTKFAFSSPEMIAELYYRITLRKELPRALEVWRWIRYTFVRRWIRYTFIRDICAQSNE